MATVLANKIFLLRFRKVVVIVKVLPKKLTFLRKIQIRETCGDRGCIFGEKFYFSVTQYLDSVEEFWLKLCIALKKVTHRSVSQNNPSSQKWRRKKQYFGEIVFTLQLRDLTFRRSCGSSSENLR